MKKRSISILMVLSLSVIFIAGLTLLPCKTLAKDKPILIKLPCIVPKSPPSPIPYSRGIAFLAKKLEENSGGRFKVQVYWGSSLYRDGPAMYAALRDNVIQLAFSAGARLGGEIPGLNIFELPFMWKNLDHIRKFCFGPKGYKPMGPAQKLFEPLFEKHGYKLLFFTPGLFQNFISSKGFLVKPEDFKGVKFRVRPAKLTAEIMKALGGSAQAIPFLETYNALSLKTVDASEQFLYFFVGMKWYEVCDYVTISRHTTLSSACLTNPTFYNGLPEDLKKIFNDTLEEFNRFVEEIHPRYEQRMPWIMMSQRPSIKFRWLTEEERGRLKEQVKPLLDKYRKKIPKKFWDAVDATRPK